MMASSVHTAHPHLFFLSPHPPIMSSNPWPPRNLDHPHCTLLHVLLNMDTLKQTISHSAIVLPFFLRLTACSMVLSATSKERQRSQVATGIEYECSWQCGNMGNQSTKDSSIYLINPSSSLITCTWMSSRSDGKLYAWDYRLLKGFCITLFSLTCFYS